MTAEQIIAFIANDYWELSSEKIRFQYNQYKQMCKDYLKEHNEGPISHSGEYDTFHDDF